MFINYYLFLLTRWLSRVSQVKHSTIGNVSTVVSRGSQRVKTEISFPLNYFFNNDQPSTGKKLLFS